MSKRVLFPEPSSQKYDILSISDSSASSESSDTDLQNEIIFRQECRIWLRENAKALFDLEKKKKKASMKKQQINL